MRGSGDIGFYTRTLAPAVSRSYADCLSSMRTARSLERGASTGLGRTSSGRTSLCTSGLGRCLGRCLGLGGCLGLRSCSCLGRSLGCSLGRCLGCWLGRCLGCCLDTGAALGAALGAVLGFCGKSHPLGTGRKGESASYAGSVGRSSIIFFLFGRSSIIFLLFGRGSSGGLGLFLLPGGLPLGLGAGCACFIGFF